MTEVTTYNRAASLGPSESIVLSRAVILEYEIQYGLLDIVHKEAAISMVGVSGEDRFEGEVTRRGRLKKTHGLGSTVTEAVK